MAINLQGNNTSTYSDDVTISGDLSAANGTFSGDVTQTSGGTEVYRSINGQVILRKLNLYAPGGDSTTDPGVEFSHAAGEDYITAIANNGSGVLAIKSNASGAARLYFKSVGNTDENVQIYRQNENLRLAASGGEVLVDQNLKIGGTLPASPNITLAADGDIRIGKNCEFFTGTTPNGTLLFDPNASGGAGAMVARCFGGNGTGAGGVELIRNATSWGAYSQRSLKTNLVPIVSGLEKVSTLSAVTGKYKTDEEGTSRSFLIADEVQQVLPEAVSGEGTEEDPLSLRYTEVIPLLVSALHDAKARIEALEAQLSQLTTTGGASS